jgi:hypothetical protein
MIELTKFAGFSTILKCLLLLDEKPSLRGNKGHTGALQIELISAVLRPDSGPEPKPGNHHECRQPKAYHPVEGRTPVECFIFDSTQLRSCLDRNRAKSGAIERPIRPNRFDG